MKTKNILLLIVAIIISFSTVSAQYIENDTRVLDEGAKNTKTMSITTTSAEPEAVNTMSIEEVEALETTDAEPTLYDDNQPTTNNEATPELAYDDEEINYNLLYLLGVVILFVLMLVFVLNKGNKE